MGALQSPKESSSARSFSFLQVPRPKGDQQFRTNKKPIWLRYSRVSAMKNCLLLYLFQRHLYGALWAHGRADAASLTIIEVNQDLAGFLVSCDAEVRTEEAAHIARFALP